jgi:hypothetical protein
MYQTFGTEITRGRMDDRIREAQAFRRSRETRSARRAGHGAAFRKVGAAALHVILWPVRH